MLNNLLKGSVAYVNQLKQHLKFTEYSLAIISAHLSFHFMTLLLEVLGCTLMCSNDLLTHIGTSQLCSTTVTLMMNVLNHLLLMRNSLES